MCQLSHYTEQYFLYCEYQKGLNAKTIKAYKIDMQQFFEFLQSNKITNVEKSVLNAYIKKLHENYSVKTVKRKIASLKAFFNWLEFEEVIIENPFSKIKLKYQEPFVLPRTIPVYVIEKLIATAYELRQQAKTEYAIFSTSRDVAVLELLFATGMRISEICNLKIQDVHLQEEFVLIHGKGNKERVIHISNADVLNTLRYYDNFTENFEKRDDYYFLNKNYRRISEQSVRNMIKKYSAYAGISINITPHMFRHSFATLLLEEDVDIRYIQHLLGHSSITTTQIYTHIAMGKQKEILHFKIGRAHV